MAVTGLELCRVTLVAPKRRVDVSLPADVPLSQLMPTLLRVAGTDLADQGLAHSGWVLQRLDEAPLDAAQPLDALGVRDGDLLYFRPRMVPLPEMAFDDVADVIAAGIRERGNRWRAPSTRSFGLGAGVGMLVVGAIAILLSGPGWLIPAIAAGGIAVLLALAAGILSRVVGDSGAGVIVGYGALPYAFIGGLLAPARDSLGLSSLGAPHLMSGFGALVLVSIIVGFGVADSLPQFLGIATAGLVGLAEAGLVLGADWEPAGVAAVFAALTVALTAMIPSLSFKLARLPLPAVPANAEELRNDSQLINGRGVLERTSVADGFTTGLVSGVALSGIAASLSLVMKDGWLALTTCIFLSAALVLRARVFHGRPQRLWLLIAGLGGLAVFDLGLVVRGSQTTALIAVLLPLLCAVALSVGLALWLPRHKPTPFWGRAGDIVDLLVVLTLIPLALGVIGLYSWVKGVAS
jgi:type VII secretion integral membrane protein EccD